MDKHERGQVTTTAAEIYESFFVPALFAEWPPHILEAAGVKQGDHVLDVACGTGVLAKTAVLHTGISGSVTAVDINEGMLAVAQQSPLNIVWKVGAAESLPFEDLQFDHVLSQFGLMFFTNQVDALKEMVRVTKPGGTIAVAVWGQLADTPGYAAIAHLLNKLFGTEIAKSIEAPYSLGDVTQLTALFTQAGMPEINIQTINGQARFASIDDWIFTDLKGWTLADIIDDNDYERFRQAALEELQSFVQTDGSVAFDAPAHIITVSK